MTMSANRRMKVFCVANQKGGVGKTTTAVHATHHFAKKKILDDEQGKERNARVAFINVEVQRNGSNTLKKVYGVANVTAAAFFKPEPFEIVVNEPVTVYEGGPFMADIERSQGAYFKAHIERIAPFFDYCVIDTPPSAGVLQIAPLTAAHYVLSPIELEEYSMDGVVDMLKTIMGVKQRYNPGLEFLGMLPSRLQNTSPRQREALKDLLTRYPQFVFGAKEGAKVSARQAIPEALAEGVPVWDLKKSSAHDSTVEMRLIMALLDQRIGV
jgi:chromosome partitioning protein